MEGSRSLWISEKDRPSLYKDKHVGCRRKKKEGDGDVVAMASAHVDDNGIMASKAWLQWAYSEFVKKFGDVTRQTLPLRH